MHYEFLKQLLYYFTSCNPSKMMGKDSKMWFLHTIQTLTKTKQVT